MLPLAIIVVFGWMAEFLFVGIVGANDEVLHVIHARFLEPAKNVSVSCTES
jgi:hypothetical protein